ncbi:MAG: 2-dehydropantoate 2-reductase [Firmicutes bacterium]|nr:2-dehydropantoate 2-reductase [Bacillota bacterium]
MRIIIIGSGAIGSFVGGMLGSTGQDVYFYDIPGVAEKLRLGGIKVEGIGSGVFIENPQAISSLDELGEDFSMTAAGSFFDLAVISVKSFSTKSIIDVLPDNLADYVLSFQNGIGNEEILAEKFGRHRIIAGSITYPVAFPQLGYVRIENTKGGLSICPIAMATEASGIAEIFRKAGLNIIICRDAAGMKWSKLMLNIVCNASCAILGMTPDEIFKDRQLVWIERNMILELLDVMKAKKIRATDLPGYPVNAMKTAYRIMPPSLLKIFLGKAIGKSRGKKKPSLMIEIEKGTTTTEVGYYNGAIARAGEKAGIPTPVNRLLTDILDGIASGKIPSEKFAKNPSLLYQICRQNDDYKMEEGEEREQKEISPAEIMMEPEQIKTEEEV